MAFNEIINRAKEDNIKFISLQFTDVTGSVKSVDIPIIHLERALEEGIWFDGSSVEGFARIQESDMRLVIDPETYAVLPWSPEDLKRARFFCDIHQPNGEPFIGNPRNVLKNVLDKINQRGWVFNVGAEPEFFLFKRNGEKPGNIHPVPHDVGGYFDFSAVDEAVRVRTEIMDAISNMGLDVEMGHHEVALGQHEIDFRFSDALQAADNVITMKYAVKAISAKHGLVASFMPKPIIGINGSGMHAHQSIFDKEGNNLFYDPQAEFFLSEFGRRFIAGQLAHARSMSAVLSPTVNSYKRLVPGYEAPVYVGWAQVNRSALIRIPSAIGDGKAVRAELRCPDPSNNPYLAFAVMLAAGLDGNDSELDCPEPLNNVNVYELTKQKRIEMGIMELPGSLGEALAEMDRDMLIKETLGPVAYEAFYRAKMEEWTAYRLTVTDWEVDRYLEIA
ncbi:MAG: type I glutamate--ammonia ligase [Anaerolineales bacterium]|jgi:glutamine synthetase